MENTQIVKKRKIKNKIKQKIEQFLIWAFMVIGMLFVLNWAIGVFHEAGHFWLEPKKLTIDNSSVGVVATAVAHAETSSEGSKLGEERASKTLSSPEELITKYFGEEAELAIAVAKCESQLDPTREGDTHMAKHSYGLFQINRTWHDYTPEQLKDPEFNCKIAKEIRDKGGWNRWTCYSKNYYQKYL